ncbi:hypothetical protein J6590_039285 [Homalodisca vitripennis]|nr:hypothetical protein J6590_039285 [Homalodisca vitripennis]
MPHSMLRDRDEGMGDIRWVRQELDSEWERTMTPTPPVGAMLHYPVARTDAVIHKAMETLPIWVALVALLPPPLTSAGTGLSLRRSVDVLPHDTYPGFSIKKFDSDHSMNYRLLETGFSQFFTVLEDGLVMTTSDLTPLVNRPVNLVVLEETPNATATHTLQLYVLDRRDMLRFPQETYEGARIVENAPAGTVVSGVPTLRAIGGGAGGLPLKYSIVGGNIEDAFALKKDDSKTPGNSVNGVKLVTKKPLDRETVASYTLTIQASDGRDIDKAVSKVLVQVEDENDNSPVFSQKVYRFSVGGLRNRAANGTEWKRFAAVGRVSATDADGDHVAYRLAVPSDLVVIVPQTGDLLLTGEPPSSAAQEGFECELTVEAHDLRTPNRVSHTPAQVWLQLNTYDEDELQGLGDESPHRISKRRVTRAVRPTKRIEFTEADGEQEGRIVFQLEKETERETFKIRDENPWVTVEPNGAVRVKKKWDYEELGPEKTIDFWVTITNAASGGVVSHIPQIPQLCPPPKLHSESAPGVARFAVCGKWGDLTPCGSRTVPVVFASLFMSGFVHSQRGPGPPWCRPPPPPSDIYNAIPLCFYPAVPHFLIPLPSFSASGSEALPCILLFFI